MKLDSRKKIQVLSTNKGKNDIARLNRFRTRIEKNEPKMGRERPLPIPMLYRKPNRIWANHNNHPTTLKPNAGNYGFFPYWPFDKGNGLKHSWAFNQRGHGLFCGLVIDTPQQK